jgi:hypothetical protein
MPVRGTVGAIVSIIVTVVAASPSHPLGSNCSLNEFQNKLCMDKTRRSRSGTLQRAWSEQVPPLALSPDRTLSAVFSRPGCVHPVKPVHPVPSHQREEPAAVGSSYHPAEARDWTCTAWKASRPISR